MDISWLIHESPGLKPHWLGNINIFFVKNSHLVIQYLSNIFTATGGKDIGQ